MNRVVHYLPCSIVCHGECELILVKQIQNKKRRFLNPLAEDNGRQSILVNTLNFYLNKLSPTKKTYIKKYKDLLAVDKEANLVNHKIFTIMDKDDTSEEMMKKYINKSLFKDYWWGQEDIIEPIYFIPDMDTVLSKHGIIINKNKSKPTQYFEYLTTQYERIIDILRSLDSNESNIKILFDYLEKIKNNDYKK